MDFTPAPKQPIGRDSSGIALFMVIAAVSVLAILVTEFTYIAQISQMIAFGGLDQTQAHYLAKSGLKLSLLRLKAFKQSKAIIASLGAGANAIPKSVIDKIWSFPFFYPFPTDIPGLGTTEKDAIAKFQKESSLEGKYSAIIESESSKYNLNMILPNFAPSPVPGPSASPTPNPPNGSNGTPAGTPNPVPTGFNADEARKSLSDFLSALLNHKILDDPDLADVYRDVRVDELTDTIVSWADRKYERRTSSSHDPVPMKRAPFYSLTELHMLPNIDDDLYNLFTPNLTAGLTQGINVNTIQKPTLKALLPMMTDDEITEFYKYRDSEDVDNQFQDSDKFFDYISKTVAAFKSNSNLLTELKESFAKRNIIITVEETFFKITVKADVNQASRTIQAWVTLGSGSGPTPQASGTPPVTSQPGQPNAVPDPGLKINFMRIL